MVKAVAENARSQSKGHLECVKVSGEKQEAAEQSAGSDRQPVYLIQKTISGANTFNFYVVKNQFLVYEIDHFLVTPPQRAERFIWSL